MQVHLILRRKLLEALQDRHCVGNDMKFGLKWSKSIFGEWWLRLNSSPSFCFYCWKFTACWKREIFPELGCEQTYLAVKILTPKTFGLFWYLFPPSSEVQIKLFLLRNPAEQVALPAFHRYLLKCMSLGTTFKRVNELLLWIIFGELITQIKVIYPQGV